ncbi:MAG: hypothetical protein LBQ66_13795 [Planctomycetaceae bacterium]|jgi:hypothetical protein|nr:hypothetical protein [Planctomycetaceae bacterium]
MSTNLEAEVTRNRSWFARRRVWYVLLVLFVLFLLFLYFCLLPSRLIISPETTLITKLDNNGKLDYEGTFKREHNRQLTLINPDDNGSRMVMAKFGPRVIERSYWLKSCTWEDLPKDRTYMGEWYRTRWIPFCNAMSIDPTKKPVEYRPIWLKLSEAEGAKNKKYPYQSELSRKPWRAEDYPEVAKFVAEAEDALAVYSAAAQKPQWVCYWEASGGTAYAFLSDDTYTSWACQDFVIRAHERISRNDVAGAFDDAVSILRIARHVQNSSTLMERSFGINNEMSGIDVIQSILTYCNPSTEQIRQFMSELEKIPKPVNISDKILLWEEMRLLDVLFNSNNDNFSLSFASYPLYLKSLFVLLTTLPVDYNIASKRIQANFKRFEELSKENDIKKRTQFYYKFDADIKHLETIIYSPAELLIRETLIAHRSTLLADCMFYFHFADQFRFDLFDEARMDMQRDLLRVSFALELYQRENGHYPDKLELIAPKYIDVIPEDPFTSKELTYKKIDNGYILYSFGQNKIDDGGDNSKSYDPKDIVVERKRYLNEQ